MDAETLKLVADVLTHGGSAAALLLALIMWNVAKVVKTAAGNFARMADTLDRIEKALTGAAEIAKDNADHQDGKLERIHEDIKSLPGLMRRARFKSA